MRIVDVHLEWCGEPILSAIIPILHVRFLSFMGVMRYMNRDWLNSQKIDISFSTQTIIISYGLLENH